MSLRRSYFGSLLALGLLLAANGAASAAEGEAKPLRGLLISGGCCHDYPRQDKIIAEGVSQRANIVWDVISESTGKDHKSSAYAKEDWSAGYDIVVHNECYGGVGDPEFVERIVKGHRDTGVPAVFIHCAMHSYRGSSHAAEWRNLLGVTTTHHEKAKRSLDVKRVAENPILAEFPELWKTPNGELYVIDAVGPKTTPLCTAYSEETKTELVCMWTNEYGKARVFGTTLGHHNETMMCDEWLNAVSRGVLWCCGKLEADGSPAAGFAGTGKAPFSFVAAVDGPEPTRADWSASVKFPESEKPVKLFNGKDMSGWEGNKEKYFNVVDGEIVAKNTAENAPAVSNYLLTEKHYRNFRLVFEGKLAESEMHSGIALWGKKYEKDGEKFSYQGHLVMFPSGWGFYDLYRRNMIYKDDGRAKAADNKDWNRMEILAIGNRIRLAVNGKLVADWEDPKPELCEAGPIGLQHHSNKVPQEIRFRGLILSEDPEDKLITLED